MYLEANGAHDHPTLNYYYYVKLCVWVAGAMSELCTWNRNYVCHLLATGHGGDEGGQWMVIQGDKRKRSISQISLNLKETGYSYVERF